MSDRWSHSILRAAEGIPNESIPVWNDLAERVGASPFLRSGWCAAWRRAFGQGTLEVHLLRSDESAGGSIAALLPLERRGSGLVSPTNWHTPEFGILSESERATRALLEAIFRSRPRRLILSFLPRDQVAIIEELQRSAGYSLLQRVTQRAPPLMFLPARFECIRPYIRAEFGKRGFFKIKIFRETVFQKKLGQKPRLSKPVLRNIFGLKSSRFYLRKIRS